ncbi:hypothetical protein ONE63_004402 [Megalurothrips usitatus]|uniref:Peroxisomal ATPase PEX1 n=1 Tax=Megalurothrips usitatus TaxID=439358 RepID=A0AAV7X636_9NEOP|nr:hypothetical protein ONE63_004402 [Megalurothrips usitatus]
MSGDLFRVQFIRSKTCFLFIPDKWVRKLTDIRKLEPGSTIKVIYDSGKYAYFSWQQSSMQHDNVVGINATVATNLGFKEGDLISLVICNNPPHLHRVEMCPLSADDLEMIELSSGLLQATLLDQVRVVWRGQFLTAWISNTLPIVLHVGSMDPDVNVGRLEQLTEVVIGDPLNNVLPSSENHWGSKSMLNDIVSSGKSLASSVINSVKGETQEEVEESFENELLTERSKYVFRVHPLHRSLPQHGPLDAFIPSACMSDLFKFPRNQQKSLFLKVTKLPSSKDVSATIVKGSEEGTVENVLDEQINESLSTNIRAMSVDCIQEAKEHYYFSNRKCIYMSNNLRSTLHLQIGSQVILSDFQRRPPSTSLEGVELLPVYGLSCLDLGKNFVEYVEQMRSGLVLSNKMLLTIPTEKGYIDTEVQLLPSSVTYSLVLPGQLDSRRVYVRLEKRTEKQPKVPPVTPSFPTSVVEDLHLGHLSCVINEALASLKLTLGLHESYTENQSVRINNNILILGKSGCGKTSTANTICNHLQGSPHYVYNAVMKCRPLKGKTVESIFKHLQSFIDECVYNQPSILILDDLECIAGVSEDQDQSSQASAYFNRISRMLLQIFSCLQSCHSIGIIATAPSLSSLSSSLVPPRGIHILNTCLELPELAKVDRLKVLDKLLNIKLKNKEIREIKCWDTLEVCSKKSEGYCCQDLADLVDKAMHVACMRQVDSNKTPVLEACDMLQALSDSTPMLLRGVSLHKEAAFGWDDIGGMIEVKNELKEVFEWPVMYPELFQNSPLRQQSGLLLYGAPGTGKTMLAAAIASECGLNFISVKGPELLSKYIGASEEAVRNIFFKAQSAKPCVLFFDEFDSLAPRRGHDNTGVTDRVVNQLLTQLDGVESLVGVWVLAATSRPDLLDPALLRPGRLDRAVLCPLPDEKNRLAILTALSQKMNLDADVDFVQIAVKTEGFTGADLQSLLYTAQLSAVEEQQAQISGECLVQLKMD